MCRRTCGTFGRTAAAEGQYALRSGHSLRNFSEQELVDCQWQQRGLPVPPGITAGDPLIWMDDKGFLSSEDYPYLTGGPECVVYNYTYNNTCHSCSWKASEVITGSSGKWTGIASATGEDQMAAFVRHNGPIWIGINSRVFGLRDNVTNQVLACNGTQAGGGGTPDNCFITKAMCTDGRVSKQIDHAVTVVGYGADGTDRTGKSRTAGARNSATQVSLKSRVASSALAFLAGTRTRMGTWLTIVAHTSAESDVVTQTMSDDTDAQTLISSASCSAPARIAPTY